MRHEVEILEAQELACDHYNIPRQEFVELAARRYPLVGRDSQKFLYALKAYDQIQEEMLEVA